MPPFDLVTVTHFEELPILRLQAKSMRRWLSLPTGCKIWLIINESSSCPSYDENIAEIRELYGHVSQSLIILNRSDVHSDLEEMPGYVTQQILKLRICDLIDTPFYTVMDTKNVLIDEVGSSYLFTDGFPRMRFETYANSHQAYILRSYYELFGIPIGDQTNYLPAMMTPFTFAKEPLKKTICFIEARLGNSIEDCFAITFSKGYLYSEFLLFSAAVEAQGMDVSSLYARVDRMSVTLWGGNALGIHELRHALEGAISSKISVIGLHRNRVRQMDAIERNYMTDFLRSREIINGNEQFAAFT